MWNLKPLFRVNVWLKILLHLFAIKFYLQTSNYMYYNVRKYTNTIFDLDLLILLTKKYMVNYTYFDKKKKIKQFANFDAFYDVWII